MVAQSGLFTQEDITILNYFRCEPPSDKFDFFSYGGLPRSVLKLLSNSVNLETIIQENNRRYPSSDSGHNRIFYEQSNGIGCIILNTYNNNSKRSDAKFFHRAAIKSSDGNQYTFNSLALEVYRKGNQPIWELGFYITDKSGKEVIYGEEALVKLPANYNREAIFSAIAKFASSLKEYDSSLNGITHNNFHYLKNILTCPLISLSEPDFIKIRSKILRYLTGTLGEELTFKFEDRIGYKDAVRVRRLKLVRVYQSPVETHKCIIENMADTEGESANPDFWASESKPLRRNRALNEMIRLASHYLEELYINAGKTDWYKHVISKKTLDFRFATVVPDKLKNPIAIISWDSRYDANNIPLPLGKVHHYLDLYGQDSSHLRLDEGIHFDQGVHPRTFMPALVKAMPQVVYRNDTSFINDVKACGVPFHQL